MLRKLTRAGFWLAVGLFVGGVALQGFWALHLGAPPLVYPCPPGHTLVARWEKGTPADPEPGELTYHGWTRWASCAQSTTISGG